MKSDNEIIEALGGNQSVADLCQPTQAAVVSGWRKRGIPTAWRRYLQAKRPDVFCDATPNLPPAHVVNGATLNVSAPAVSE